MKVPFTYVSIPFPVDNAVSRNAPFTVEIDQTLANRWRKAADELLTITDHISNEGSSLAPQEQGGKFYVLPNQTRRLLQT